MTKHRYKEISICEHCGSEFHKLTRKFGGGSYRGKFCSFECNVASKRKLSSDQVFEYLKEYMHPSGLTPTRAEIADHFSVSISVVNRKIDDLERRNKIQRVPNRNIIYIMERSA